jgi:hypothetical protein
MCIVRSVGDGSRKLGLLNSSHEYILYWHFDLGNETTTFLGNVAYQSPSDAAFIPERRQPTVYDGQYTKPVAAPWQSVPHTALLTRSCGYALWSIVTGGSWGTDWETLLSLIYLWIGGTFAINVSWIVYSCHAVKIGVYTSVTWCYLVLDWSVWGPFVCWSATGSDFASDLF